MKTIGIVVAFVGVIVFSKFYLSAPTVSDGQDIVSKYVYDHSEGNMRLAGFKQTGGREYMLSGVRIYVMTFEGQVVSTSENEPQESSTFEFAFDRSRGIQAQPLHAGEVRTVRGAIQFEKTAYSWVGQPM